MAKWDRELFDKSTEGDLISLKFLKRWNEVLSFSIQNLEFVRENLEFVREEIVNK